MVSLDLATTENIGVMHPDLILNRNTWIISDTHFGHANIIKYCDRPYDHNSRMLNAWDRLIKPSDYVLHLGDVTIWHRSHVTWAERVKKLPGKKFLILGNHDEQWTPKQWRTIAGMQVTDPFVWNDILFSHEPGFPSGKWIYNVHGHTHTHKPFRVYSRLQSTYYNASIEGMNYSPVRLGEILDELGG